MVIVKLEKHIVKVHGVIFNRCLCMTLQRLEIHNKKMRICHSLNPKVILHFTISKQSMKKALNSHRAYYRTRQRLRNLLLTIYLAQLESSLHKWRKVCLMDQSSLINPRITQPKPLRILEAIQEQRKKQMPIRTKKGTSPLHWSPISQYDILSTQD